jgi:uncharacterized repeat protein (TIGR02543 family)
MQKLRFFSYFSSFFIITIFVFVLIEYKDRFSVRNEIIIRKEQIMKNRLLSLTSALFLVLNFIACIIPSDPYQDIIVITYNTNGGSAIPNQYVAKGSTAVEPLSPAKTGYECKFLGWFSDKGFTSPFEFTEPLQSNVSLFAKWAPYELGETGPGGGKIFYRTADGFTVKIPLGLVKYSIEPFSYRLDIEGKDPLPTAYDAVTHKIITIAVQESRAFYLEAAPTDLDTTYRWVEDVELAGTTVFSIMNKTLGMGRVNTAFMLDYLSSAPAAKACNTYVHNGKSGWFLPSGEELNLLIKNRINVGNLKNDYYWASNGYRTVDPSISIILVDEFQMFEHHAASSKFYVRPIRAF